MSATRKIWRVFILLISWHCLANAQSLDETYKLAKHFETNQQYDAAIELFQRVIFFDTSDVYLKDALLTTANIYFIQGNYNKASKYYAQCYHLFEEDTSTAIIYQQIKANLLDNRYYTAFEELLYLQNDQINNPIWEKDYRFLKAVTHYGLQQYDSSKHYFILLAYNNKETEEYISRQFESLFKKEKKKKNLAYAMSAVFPGLGQLYAGDYRNGINVFFLSAGFMALAIYTGITFSPSAALLNVLPWWSRYHFGGMSRAEDSVENFKIKARKNIYLNILEKLELYEN